MNMFIYYLIGINIFTFIIFGLDKLLAIKHKNRISENLLLFLSLIGGCFLEMVGMFVFRHKIRKWYFYVLNILFICGYIYILIKVK